MSLLITLLLVPACIALIVSLAFAHMPKCIQSLVGLCPSWLWALILHVATYLLLGGVTGHLIALGLDPWVFLIHWLFLRDYCKNNTSDYLRNLKVVKLWNYLVFVWHSIVTRINRKIDSIEVPYEGETT